MRARVVEDVASISPTRSRAGDTTGRERRGGRGGLGTAPPGARARPAHESGGQHDRARRRRLPDRRRERERDGRPLPCLAAVKKKKQQLARDEKRQGIPSGEETPGFLIRAAVRVLAGAGESVWSLFWGVAYVSAVRPAEQSSQLGGAAVRAFPAVRVAFRVGQH